MDIALAETITFDAVDTMTFLVRHVGDSPSQGQLLRSGQAVDHHGPKLLERSEVVKHCPQLVPVLRGGIDAGNVEKPARILDVDEQRVVE